MDRLQEIGSYIWYSLELCQRRWLWPAASSTNGRSIR